MTDAAMLSLAARKCTAKRTRLIAKLDCLEAAALRHVKAHEEAEARRLLQVGFNGREDRCDSSGPCVTRSLRISNRHLLQRSAARSSR